MPSQDKIASLNGYQNDTTPTVLTKRLNMSTNKGSWRRFRLIHSLEVKHCVRTWESHSEELADIPPIEIVSPIPSGMVHFTEKALTASSRNFASLPIPVKKYFKIDKAEQFHAAKLKLNVSWREPQKSFRDFYHIYCYECEHQRLPEIWKKHGDKLPSEIDIKNLLEHWDRLSLTWMDNDVAGCVVPDDPTHYAFINARHFLQRPSEHYESVHEPKEPTKKKMKKQVITKSFFKSRAAASSETVSPSSGPIDLTHQEDLLTSSSSSSTSSSKSSKSLKTGSGHPKLLKLQQLKVDQMISPTIKIDHKPTSENGIDTWALGSMIMTVHNGVNKNLSNQAVLEYHQVGNQMVRDYHKAVATSKKEFSTIPCPPKVSLNDHNITTVQKALYETYRWENQDDDNPYRLLEQCDTFSIMHDATSYWVQQFNTVMVRVITDDLDIIRVPFSFRSVTSLTGEALADEIIDVVSAIKKVTNNAFDNIHEAIQKSRASTQSDEEVVKTQYKELCGRLTAAATALKLEEMKVVQEEIENLAREFPSVLFSDEGDVAAGASYSTAKPPAPDDVIKPPNYFKLARIKTIDNENMVILLEIEASNVPCCQCGDGCATNMKAARLVEGQIGLQATFTRCSSHASSNTIKRLCTSKTMCNEDAKSLYENLRALLGHFSQSMKSTGFLNQALKILEMNEIHIMNWGSTRMSGFMDACHQCSTIIVPLLDTIITMNIRPDETKFIGSAKGIFLLQLFNDIHDLYTNKYLHKVDGEEKVLACEGYNIAIDTATKLASAKTPLADDLLSSLHEDENRNLKVVFKLKGSEHVLTLNERLTNRNKSLDKIKDDLRGVKEAIFKNIIDNINDQNNSESLLGLMSAFDLSTDEDYDGRVEKITKLFDMYGCNKEHEAKAWNGYSVQIEYKKRLNCSLMDLLDQFKKAWPKINKLSEEFLTAKEKQGSKVTQYYLWKRFISNNSITCRYLCFLLKIMIGTPVNTGWVERAYSTLEQLCPKRRNRLDPVNLKYQFFMSTLRKPVRDAFSYNKEIKNIGKNTFPKE